MSEENKALVRQGILATWALGNAGAMDEYYAEDFVNHSAPPGTPSGLNGMKASASVMMNAFSDVEVTIDDQIAEGDLVVTRWSGKNTHSGEFMGIPATGKRLSLTGIAIDRIANGKIVESWSEWDMMGLMQQLGAVPSPGG
jgi:steroid delta-isomerase-like uncharacterized protein